ncbi:GTPase-associated protein 1-related protein [Streptomyces sp. NPDC046261]|uniref:GTPase-associated protein 1-related protein n=1 Tax=Streptomyces sp. NPDC046261 TaxID=3157200 RepID=UPI0033D0CF58
MSLAQLHYTSAPPGPDGSGFRFTAVSPEVPASLVREAEQLIGYEPPRDAPPRPTESDLAAFPEAFSHSVLSDGSRLLARTVYKGADYSGRWGNFHAHAVHLPVGTTLPGGVRPITAWRSPRWASATPDGGVPEPLEALPAPGQLTKDGLVAFAASRAPWLAGFFADLRRLAEDDAAPQIVLIERDSADVAWWIALASAVLPRENAHRLTFTTYTRRPQLARQQIIGVLPEDGRQLSGYDQRYRVYDCTGPGPAQAVADAWAETAAHIWLGRAPALFMEADQLPGGPFAPGPLAALALCAGLGLGTGGRTEAADWAHDHGQALGDERSHRLAAALCAPAQDRAEAETAALTRLLRALDGRAPTATTAPLAAVVLTEAVRSPGSVPSPVPLRRGALTEDLARRLAADLAPDLRAGLVGAGQDTARPVELLRIAGVLGVDCSDLLPRVARGLTDALLADPDAVRTPAVRRALEEHAGLRAALFDRLDEQAVADPPAAARLLALFPPGLLEESRALPHVRMCAEASRMTEGAGDRVTALNAVVRAAGVSVYAEPDVLRTAVRLVWDGRTPTAGEARLTLGEMGAAAHRAAGTWSGLVTAALEGPVGDPDVPELAHDLLRRFSEDLAARERAALLLLEFARDLRNGSAGPGWTDRALSLRKVAEPVEPTVLGHAFGTLVHRLLAEDRPDGELDALILGGDPDLLATYDRVARSEAVRDRLRTTPSYAADCFVAWSSHPQAGGAWQETRTALLDSVLRPVVRELPATDIASLESRLEDRGVRWAEEFRAWNRPGAFGRLGRRLVGRGRRGTAGGHRWGDVEPPRKDGRPS